MAYPKSYTDILTGPFGAAANQAMGLHARATAPITPAQQAQRDKRRGNYAQFQPGLNQVPATQPAVNPYMDILKNGLRPSPQLSATADGTGGLGTGGDVATGGITGGLADTTSYTDILTAPATTTPMHGAGEWWKTDQGKAGLTNVFEDYYAQNPHLDPRNDPATTTASIAPDASQAGGYSDNFAALDSYGTNEEFLAGIGMNQLGYDLGSEGTAFYLNKLNSGASRQQIWDEIAKGEAGRKYMTPVESEYNAVYKNKYGRDIDPQAMDWAMKNGYTPEELGQILDQNYQSELDSRTGLAASETAIDAAIDTSTDTYQEGIAEGTAVADDSLAKVDSYIAEGKDVYDPYLNTGETSTAAIDALLSGDMSGFENSPGYQNRLDESQKAIAGYAGGLPSGAVLKALQENAGNLASEDYQNYVDLLTGRADSGIQAGGQYGNLLTGGQSAATSLGGAEMNMINSMKSAQGEAEFAGNALKAQQRYSAGIAQAEIDTKIAEAIANNQTEEAGAVAEQVQAAADFVNDLINDTTGDINSEMKDWLKNMLGIDSEALMAYVKTWLSRGTDSEVKEGFLDAITQVMGMMPDSTSPTPSEPA